jgi:hypothetical protein
VVKDERRVADELIWLVTGRRVKVNYRMKRRRKGEDSFRLTWGL